MTDRDAFVARFGGIFEASPWIAAAAWEHGPYDSVADLHAAMVSIVDGAPRAARRDLICAHPDLAGKAAIAGTLTPESTREQAAAGLDRLTPAQHARIVELTAAYRERFGFPFVICAREHSADSIIAAAAERLAHDPDDEERTALAEIAKIAALRLADLATDDVPGKDIRVTDARISYGKLSVPVHLVRGERLLAADISMEVLGQGFLAAYTEGDNSSVVATDTMKNVILRRAHEYDGATLEGLLYDLGRGFLATYPEMEGLRLWAVQQPWVAETERLHRRIDGDHDVVEIELSQADGKIALVGHRAGHAGLRLLKTTGSAFTKFARDEDTTLPERGDRPLFIYLDVHWRYGTVADAIGEGRVASEDVVALVLSTFDEFVSESIQHLVHEMGTRILAAFPALSQVAFRGENHTYDPVPGAADAEPLSKTYTSAFPAYGLITLVLDR